MRGFSDDFTLLYSWLPVGVPYYTPGQACSCSRSLKILVKRYFSIFQKPHLIKSTFRNSIKQLPSLTRAPCGSSGPSSLCRKPPCGSAPFVSPGKTWIWNSSPDLTVLSWQSIWVGTSAQCFFVLVTMLQPFVGNETVSFICFSLWKMELQGI